MFQTNEVNWNFHDTYDDINKVTQKVHLALDYHHNNSQAIQDLATYAEEIKEIVDRTIFLYSRHADKITNFTAHINALKESTNNLFEHLGETEENLRINLISDIWTVTHRLERWQETQEPQIQINRTRRASSAPIHPAHQPQAPELRPDM